MISRFASTANCNSRYDHLKLVASLSTDPSFHWCLSPTCSSGQLHLTENPIFSCVACDFRQCVTHKTAWHEGETCKEHNARMTGQQHQHEEAASHNKIEETTKACPKCESRIEKNEGCDHMTCLKCSYQFCWACKCDWVKAAADAQFHIYGCLYWRPAVGSNSFY